MASKECCLAVGGARWRWKGRCGRDWVGLRGRGGVWAGLPGEERLYTCALKAAKCVRVPWRREVGFSAQCGPGFPKGARQPLEFFAPTICEIGIGKRLTAPQGQVLRLSAVAPQCAPSARGRSSVGAAAASMRMGTAAGGCRVLVRGRGAARSGALCRPAPPCTPFTLCSFTSSTVFFAGMAGLRRPRTPATPPR